MIKIQNCTVSFKFSARPLPDEHFLLIAQHGYNTEYEPRRFHAIIMRLPFRRHLHRQQQHPNHSAQIVAALIFRSGSVILTGVPHPRWAPLLSNKISRLLLASITAAGLEELYRNAIRVRALTVTNVVGCYTHPHRLAIEQLYRHLKSTCFDKNGDLLVRCVRYDPTIFPALRFKLFPHAKSPPPFTATCLAYISGKVIVTGIQFPQCHFPLILRHLIALLSQFTR